MPIQMLMRIDVYHIADAHDRGGKPDDEAEQGEQQDHEGIVIIVPLRLHGLHIEDLFCLNRAQGAEFRHIVHCEVYGEQDDCRFQQGHQQRFDVLLSAQISRAPPDQRQLDKEIALRHCHCEFRKEPGYPPKESGYGAADPGESIGLFFHKDSFLSLDFSPICSHIWG